MKRRLTSRDIFRTNLQLSLRKSKDYTQLSLATDMGITPQEFSNMLNGYQSAIPSKGFDTFESFENKVKSIMGSQFRVTITE